MLSDGFFKRLGRPALRAVHRHSGALAAQEVLYENIVRQAAASLSIGLPPLYPVRSAANWGLLYALFRIVTETPCRRILELGAGQSTLLLDALRERFALDLTTLEGNGAWADFVRRRVGGAVIFDRLDRREVHGREVAAFDPSLAAGPFDLIVVDGPFGARRRSRWTALDFLDRALGEEFVVVFDDAERIGEKDTIREFQRTPAGRRTQWNWVHGAKDQCILFTPAYSALRYI